MTIFQSLWGKNPERIQSLTHKDKLIGTLYHKSPPGVPQGPYLQDGAYSQVDTSHIPSSKTRGLQESSGHSAWVGLQVCDRGSKH